jgi:hypothetical protein
MDANSTTTTTTTAIAVKDTSVSKKRAIQSLIDEAATRKERDTLIEWLATCPLEKVAKRARQELEVDWIFVVSYLEDGCNWKTELASLHIDTNGFIDLKLRDPEFDEDADTSSFTVLTDKLRYVDKWVVNKRFVAPFGTVKEHLMRVTIHVDDLEKILREHFKEDIDAWFALSPAERKPYWGGVAEYICDNGKWNDFSDCDETLSRIVQTFLFGRVEIEL